MNSGVILSPDDYRDYPVSAVLPGVEFPPAVRLDHKILSIRDQGFWPTCVGKAAAGIMSADYKTELSTIFIYAKCKELDGIPNLPGTYPRTAMKVISKYGACLAKILPYDLMSDPLPKITSLHYLEAEQRKAHAYARASGLNDIKQALVYEDLLLATLLVGDNFMYHRSNDVVVLPTGRTHGYHGIIICGYDDSKYALRIANSWGDERWGEGGFAWLSYKYLQSNRLVFPEAWVVDVTRNTDNCYPDRIIRDAEKIKKKPNDGGKIMIYEKAFWVALIGVIVPLLNHFFNFGLEVGEVLLVVLPIIALILGVSWKDAETEKAMIMLDAEMVKAGLYKAD